MEESSIGTFPRHATFDFMMTLEVVRHTFILPLNISGIFVEKSLVTLQICMLAKIYYCNFNK